MDRTNLTNGITIVYDGDSDFEGRVTIRFPSGVSVRTTWMHLARVETLVDHLRQAYEVLLAVAGSGSDLPVETLMQIDDLLFSLEPRREGRPGRKTTIPAASRKATDDPSSTPVEQ